MFGGFVRQVVAFLSLLFPRTTIMIAAGAFIRAVRWMFGRY